MYICDIRLPISTFRFVGGARKSSLAFTLRIPILALAQFNRQGDGRKGPPSLTNLRGSGQLEQDGDQVWALDRDTTLSTLEEQEATWYVLKNKVGATGSVTVHWRGKWASYENAARFA